MLLRVKNRSVLLSGHFCKSRFWLQPDTFAHLLLSFPTSSVGYQSLIVPQWSDAALEHPSSVSLLMAIFGRKRTKRNTVGFYVSCTGVFSVNLKNEPEGQWGLFRRSFLCIESIMAQSDCTNASYTHQYHKCRPSPAFNRVNDDVTAVLQKTLNKRTDQS